MGIRAEGRPCHGWTECVASANEEDVGALLGLDPRMLGRVHRQLRLNTKSGALTCTGQVTTLFDLFDCPRPERALGCNPGYDEWHPVVQSAHDSELRLREGTEWPGPDGGHHVESRVERAGTPLDQRVAGKRGLSRLVATDHRAPRRLDGNGRLLDRPVVGTDQEHPDPRELPEGRTLVCRAHGHAPGGALICTTVVGAPVPVGRGMRHALSVEHRKHFRHHNGPTCNQLARI